MASARQVPALYRILLTWVEPVFAASGSLLAMFKPADYLNTMTPHLTYRPQLQILFDQIGAVYALFAFNSGVVLRVTDDLRVWKTMMTGIWICDMLHIWASAKELGLDVFLNPLAWRPEDWTNIGILVGMMLVRVAFIFEVGFPSQNKKKSL